MSKELTNIVPPPDRPSTGTRRWEDVESELGVSLPKDVQWLAETYGTGQLAKFFRLRDPRQAEFPVWVASVRDAQRESGDDVDAGLLPVAHTDNGDTLWVDAERVVVTEGRGPERHEFAGTLTTFLAQVLSGEHECAVFPEDVASLERSFKPWKKVSAAQVVLDGGDGSFSDHRSALIAAVSAATAPAGDAEVVSDKSYTVKVTKGYAAFSLSAGDGGALALSLTFLAEDEAAVRSLARSFVEARKLKVTSIASQQTPIWPEGL